MYHDFIPLACHSVYSMRWGTASVEALCERARRAGIGTLAFTDRGALWARFFLGKGHGDVCLTPIIGARFPKASSEAYLLVAGSQGYRRLLRILTRYHQERGSFSLLEALKEDRRGMVVMSPSISFLQALAHESGTGDLYLALCPYGVHLSEP